VGEGRGIFGSEGRLEHGHERHDLPTDRTLKPVTERFRLNINGAEAALEADPDTPLLYALRNDLGLKGTRFGCGSGQCGACFVLIDGHPAPACDTPLWSVAGKSITTVEGLGTRGVLHPLQNAFLAEQAAQCGYCTSGILISAAALLAKIPRPTESEVRAALDRNLCRCGSHNRMVRAVLRAAQE
jgi:nicotinate dehydrogenase subunit A